MNARLHGYLYIYIYVYVFPHMGRFRDGARAACEADGTNQSKEPAWQVEAAAAVADLAHAKNLAHASDRTNNK